MVKHFLLFTFYKLAYSMLVAEAKLKECRTFRIC